MPNDTNAAAWPDPARPGVPLNPERDGTHWLWVSQATGAMMAFQWHAPPGPDRIGAWINISREITTSHPMDAVRMGLAYCAPCLTPQEVTAREAARFAAGAEAMREAAAADVDCGCDQRDVVLARLESQGHKRASYLCHNGDICCALQAEAIRHLPLPPMPTQGDGE